MTDRLTKGDRVIVVNADDPAHNQTGTITIDDGSGLPYVVEFDNDARRPGGEWYREVDVAPAAYRPIAPGEHVPEGADVFIPAGLASRHGYTDGKPGRHRTFAAIDDDGDLPVMQSTPCDGNRVRWYLATDCYINAPARRDEVVVIDDEGEKVATEEVPEPGQAIRVLRRHAIVLEQPVSPDDLARAARALEPGMHVSIHTHTHTGRVEVVGTDPEDDRG